MANTQLPQAMLYLSALSVDPSVYAKTSVPPPETSLEDPQLRNVSEVLDAMVYFLPVTKDQAFALSLELGERVRIAVAGNDDEHFNDSAMGSATPGEAIQFVWDRVRSIAACEGTERMDRLNELIDFLYGRSEARMEARYDKRKEQCKLFFDLAAGDPESRSMRTPSQLKFVDTAKEIFRCTSELFAFSKEERARVRFTLHYCLNMVRKSYTEVKKDLWPSAWEGLEFKVRNAVAPSESFDVVRYIDDLLRPALHAVRLYNMARDRPFKRILSLPLDVVCVPTPPLPPSTAPLALPTEQDIRSFLAGRYGGNALGDEPIVSEILERTSTEVLDKLVGTPRSTLEIKPPHCESTLVHHHLSLKHSAPYAYIAVSELSCLHCALYLAACRKYTMKQRDVGERGGEYVNLVQFQTRGCRPDDVVPMLALPTARSTADLDAFVEEDMVKAVKEIVKVTLRAAVERGSGGSEDGVVDILAGMSWEEVMRSSARLRNSLGRGKAVSGQELGT